MRAARWIHSMQTPRVLVIALCLAATGCGYVKHRGQDAVDLFDVGFTVTKRPQFGIYANCPMLAPAGYGKVDGQYVGIGDGRVGVMEHHQDNLGLIVYGREKTTWGQTQEEHDRSEVNEVAPAGFVTDAVDKDIDYDPACVHYLHLGFVGVTGNIHYVEFPDFFAGWVGFDPRRDDGQPRGRAARVARARERAERKALARAEAAKPPEAVEVTEATDTATVAEPAKPVEALEPVARATPQPPAPPAVVAARPETPAPAAPPRPVSVSSSPKTTFCTQCGGRRFVERWPPVPLSGLSGIDARAAADKCWAGRWCTCWRHEEQPSGPRRARPPAPASADDGTVPDIRSLAQRGDGHRPDGQQP